MMPKELSKPAVITRIESERVKFTALLKDVEVSSYELPGVVGSWSLKDVLAHLTAWEKQMIDWIAMAWRGEEPDMPTPGTWDEYIQNFNAVHYQAKREQPLAIILEEFDQVYDGFLAALRGMPESDDHPYWRIWWGGKPSWGFADTYAHHYVEHGEQVAAWLKMIP